MRAAGHRRQAHQHFGQRVASDQAQKIDESASLFVTIGILAQVTEVGPELE